MAEDYAFITTTPSQEDQRGKGRGHKFSETKRKERCEVLSTEGKVLEARDRQQKEGTVLRKKSG